MSQGSRSLGDDYPWVVCLSQDTKSSEPSSRIQFLDFPERLLGVSEQICSAARRIPLWLTLFAALLSLRFSEGIRRVNPQPGEVVATLLDPWLMFCDPFRIKAANYVSLKSEVPDTL